MALNNSEFNQSNPQATTSLKEGQAVPDTSVPSPVRNEDVLSRYEWNPDFGYATVKDALAIVTPSPNETIQIVGYPTLPDPDAELKLFLLESSSDPFAQRDLARLIPSGEIAIVVCGYYPNINPEETPHKRNVGHACLAVGVERDLEGFLDGQLITVKQHGVMTINNPQYGLGGSFEAGGYSSYFFQKFKFPPELTAAEVAAYKKNIVTMTAIANTFIPFTDNDFNGNDPLGIYNSEKVREAGEKLILATYGDPEAISWLSESRNTAYCAELVSAGINIGATVPLTRSTVEQLRQKLAEQNGEDKYPDLYEVVSQRITSREVFQNNQNFNLQYANVGMVDESVDLQPINQRCPDADRSGTGLAFMYYGFTDIVHGSIRDTYPRKKLDGLSNEALDAAKAYNAVVAQVQTAAFLKLAERYQQIAKLSLSDTIVFYTYVRDDVIPAINREYASEAEHDTAIAALIEKGKQFTPTGPNGEGMFIPPDLYLLPTQGWADVYNVGLGFYASYLRRKETAA
jgi:hypothetical protein